LALVHHRLGHADEAERCLQRGSEWLDQVAPKKPGEPVRLFAGDWLEALLLRREAESLLKAKEVQEVNRK
jgi:hypothetical protein